jgi:hypothetical protein
MKKILAVSAVVIVVVIGILVGVRVVGTDERPRSPKVLNAPTEARQAQELQPGRQPGDPPFVLQREDH